jgi:hypothetical protein
MEAAFVETIESIFDDLELFALDLDALVHFVILVSADPSFIADPVDNVNGIVYIRIM